MRQVLDVEHQLADSGLDQLVHLAPGRAGTGLVELVIRLQGDGLAETHEHVVADAVIVRIVVARRQNENLFLEILLGGGLEGHAQIAVREESQPVAGLVPGFGIKQEGVSGENVFFRQAERLLVPAQLFLALMHHPESGTKAHPEDELPEQGVDRESVGPGDEAHLPVVDGQQHAQRVVQAILMIRHHDHGRSVSREVPHIQAVVAPVIETVDHQAKIRLDQFIGQ